MFISQQDSSLRLSTVSCDCALRLRSGQAQDELGMSIVNCKVNNIVADSMRISPVNGGFSETKPFSFIFSIT
ncbi:MAG: hypothetical protein O7A69_14815, partial [SAR324 cluster bacterium]|nr:hypothetical protein [SAR324 cluster bacterium]